MAIVMPKVVQHPSPNYSPTPISHDLFILHDQEGHTLPSVAWLCNPAARASAHYCLSEDGQTVYQLVPLGMKAWAECAFNGRGTSLEIPGFQSEGFSDDLLRVAARIGAWDRLAFGKPVRWAEGGQGEGLCSHHDLGVSGGGHVDIGPIGGDMWQKFMKMVQEEYDEMRKGPLPTFALFGAPGPHEVQLLPDTVPAPSHGGAARLTPGDTHDHLTPSGFASHSMAALQSDLNALGAGLVVDGWFGSLTREALRKFQLTHGLVGDGMIGPLSWAKIDEAMKGLQDD